MVFLASLFWLSASAQDTVDYKIGAGDTLGIVVHGQDFGNKTFRVSPSGDISFPYVGAVGLNGLTPVEAEKALEAALEDGYLVRPEVTVTVDAYGAKVDVIGAVEKEGVYTLDGASSTLRQVLAKAGIRKAGAGAVATLTRPEGTSQKIPFSELEGASGDLVLRGGDVIEVSEGHSVFLAGEVAKPGAIAFTDGITISQALIRAGGKTDFARLSGAYVVRGEQRTKVNLKRVLKGKDADFVLQPGDRVVVPVSAL